MHRKLRAASDPPFHASASSAISDFPATVLGGTLPKWAIFPLHLWKILPRNPRILTLSAKLTSPPPRFSRDFATIGVFRFGERRRAPRPSAINLRNSAIVVRAFLISLDIPSPSRHLSDHEIEPSPFRNVPAGQAAGPDGFGLLSSPLHRNPPAQQRRGGFLFFPNARAAGPVRQRPA
jgi:hypothetical protein